MRRFREARGMSGRLAISRSLVLVAVATMALLAGCGRSPSAEERAREMVPLRLAYSKKIHYAPQIIALYNGYFADEGLAVQPLDVVGGIQAAEAMTAGSADAGVMGDAPAVISVASGMALKIVTSYGGGERMHRIVGAPGTNIRTPSDFRNKRVAVQIGSSTHGGLLLFLAKNGLSADDVTLVSLDPADMPDAMLSGQIDAGAGSEPWPSNIEERVPGAYEAAMLSGLGNTYPLVMLVTERYARERPEAVAAALRATQRAVEYMRDHPEEAAAIISQASGVAVDKERRVMDTLEWGVAFDEATVESLRKTAEFLLAQGKIRQAPDWSVVADRSFVAALGRGN